MTPAVKCLIRAAIRLKRCAEHSPTCSYRQFDCQECDCGLGKVLDELKAAIRGVEREKGD